MVGAVKGKATVDCKAAVKWAAAVECGFSKISINSVNILEKVDV